MLKCLKLSLCPCLHSVNQYSLDWGLQIFAISKYCCVLPFQLSAISWKTLVCILSLFKNKRVDVQVRGLQQESQCCSSSISAVCWLSVTPEKKWEEERLLAPRGLSRDHLAGAANTKEGSLNIWDLILSLLCVFFHLRTLSPFHISSPPLLPYFSYWPHDSQVTEVPFWWWHEGSHPASSHLQVLDFSLLIWQQMHWKP